MQRVETFLGSTIGKKVVMAASGIVLFGFVVGHMLGNLQVFLGPEALNHYAELLREMLHGLGVWLARAGLLVALVAHVWASVALTRANWAARPVGYRKLRMREATYASRTMVWSGPIVLLFVFYHLAHLTFGTAHPDFAPHDVYSNVVIGFSNPWVSGFYVAAMLALGLHLYHGLWSMLQTLGLGGPAWERAGRRGAAIFTAVVVAGNVAIPLAVLAGWVAR